MSALQKIKALLADPFRGPVLRQSVPDFVALVELAIEEEENRTRARVQSSQLEQQFKQQIASKQLEAMKAATDRIIGDSLRGVGLAGKPADQWSQAEIDEVKKKLFSEKVQAVSPFNPIKKLAP